MKKYSKTLFAFAIISLLAGHSFSQILCINCYRQNPVVSTNVTNMVLNGGFETTPCGTSGYFCPSYSGYNCDLDNWYCTDGGPNTYAHSTGGNWAYVPEGNNAVYMGNWYCRICTQVIDDTSCQMNEGCMVQGIPQGYPQNNRVGNGDTAGVSISQVVSGLTVGSAYVLEFWCGGESGWNYDGVFGLDIGFGRTYLRCVETPAVTGIGLRYVVQFLATSTSHTIKFTNWGHKCQLCTEVIFDDIRVYPISQLSSIIPACALGVNNLNMSNIEVLPNQDKRQLEISFDGAARYKLQVYDMLAKEVLKANCNGRTSVDISSLRGGMYVYQISEGVNTIKGKFTLN